MSILRTLQRAFFWRAGSDLYDRVAGAADEALSDAEASLEAAEAERSGRADTVRDSLKEEILKTRRQREARRTSAEEELSRLKGERKKQ